MDNAQVADRIKDLCKSKKITVKSMLESCDLSPNFIYDFTKKGQVPSVNKIETIADYLECSVDYLLGRSEIVEVIKLPARLYESIKSKYSLNLNSFKDFININDILQTPKPLMPGRKAYFVRDIHFDKIKEIYEKAAAYRNGDIIDRDEFFKMFEYFKFVLGDYNASGYVLAKKDYPKLDEVYGYYTESFI